MKKNLFFTMLLMFVGIFQLPAQFAVMINVDNAANVEIKTQGGTGDALDLYDGMNRQMLTAEDSPLQIKAAAGAEVVSVTLNQADAIDPVDGVYSVAFSSGIMLDIVTRTGAPVVRDVEFFVVANGSGTSDASYTMQYENDGEWLDVTKNSWGMYSIPENSTVRTTAVSPYELTSITFRNGTAIETALQADGSVTFVCDYDNFYYQTIYVNLGLSPDAIQFSVTVDYAPNVTACLENQRQSPYTPLTLKDGKNEFVCLPANSPVEFSATEGASIVAMTRNGESVNPIGWGGSNGWVFELEDGDDFVVTTQGKEVDVKLTAPEGNTALDNYFFKNAKGNVYKATGIEYLLKVHAGEMIYVSPRPGTAMSYLVHQNGGQSDMYSYFRAAEGADKQNPMSVSVYGTRNVTGVVINVDDTSRVQIIQEGGRGDALELHNGNNTFALSDLRNALAISVKNGNQMVEVTKNGDVMTPNASGVYLVNVEEGDWIEITSRKNPVNVTVNFSFNDEADISWIKGAVNGQETTLTSPMTIQTYATMAISPREGYTIESLTCSTEGVELTQNTATGEYLITIPNTDIVTVDIAVSVKETEPEEGYAIVIPNGDEIIINYWEFTKNEEDGTYTYVKKLDNNTVNQVALGNYVRVYCKDSESRLKYVKVNGTDVEAYEPNSNNRIVYVKIETRTVIEAEAHTPCQAYTEQTFDDVKHIVAGTLYFDIDGKQETRIYPEAGETVKFIPAPEKGYLFDHIEMFYSNTMAANGIALDKLEYTFTETDTEENYILFKAVFKEDPEEKSYVVRGSTAWLMDTDGNIITGTEGAVGNVVFQTAEGKLVREISGIEGETVKLFVSVSEQEYQDKYEVAYYCFMEGFPNNKISGSEYVIDAKDANAENVIWINAVVKATTTGVDNVDGTTSLFYDADNQVIRASDAVMVFGMSGKLLISTERHEVSVSGLPAGTYIVVSGKENIKIAK
ncbi:MAG: hypothetical protein ACI3Z7_07745 [Candidatus Aphodosoma sp.]